MVAKTEIIYTLQFGRKIETLNNPHNSPHPRLASSSKDSYTGDLDIP